MSNRELINALKERYKTPRDAIRALGLDESILDSSKKAKLSSTAIRIQGALTALYRPRLAKDATIDLTPILKDVTYQSLLTKDKKFIDRKAVANIVKLAQDALDPALDPAASPPAGGGGAGPDDAIIAVIQALTGKNAAAPAPEEDIPAAMEDPDEENPVTDNGGCEELKALLKSFGLSDEQIEQACQLAGTAAATPALDPEAVSDEDDMDDSDEDNVNNDGDDEMDDDKKKIDKPAMDAAIAIAKAETASQVKREMLALAEAREYVRPFVGAVSMACDSVPAVYKAALTTLGVDSELLKGISDPLALKLLISREKKMTERTEPSSSMALDADTATDLRKRYPHAATINIQ